MSSKRLFIALPLPDSLKYTVHHWGEQLQTELPFQKWTHPADYHITLKFLGDTTNDTMDQIKQNLHKISAAFTPFQLQVEGLGCFGSPAHPSVLWAGIHGNLETLQQLQQSVEIAMSEIGFSRENRSYHPHLTLARRCKQNMRVNQATLPSLAKRLEDDLVSWQADQIVLYASRLGQTPLYETVHTFQMASCSSQ